MKNPALQAGRETNTPTQCHTARDVARLFRLVRILQTLTPEQITTVIFFVAQLIKEGQR
jgi:hypothetical protein